MNTTTQRGVRKPTDTMSRKVKVDHLDFNCKRLKGTCYVHKLISKVRSILGNAVANIYTQYKFVKVYPNMAQKEERKSLMDFTDNVGVPETLLTDVSGEFTGQNAAFVKKSRRMRMQLQVRHNNNHAAYCEIGLLANCWRRQMAEIVILKKLYNSGTVYEYALLSII